jgi:DNA-binding SARP family transcriptional activator
VRFLDLGPLTVEIDGAPGTPGGRRVESVAAALLVNVGTPLPAAALVDAVWGASPPAGAGGALDSPIWRLRRVLEPGRGSGAPGGGRRGRPSVSTGCAASSVPPDSPSPGGPGSTSGSPS